MEILNLTYNDAMLFFTSVLVIATIVYLAVAKALPKVGIGPLLLFLWQQAFMALKLWITILFFATEYSFVKSGNAPV